MKRLVAYLINSDEFTERERIELSVQLANYKHWWTKRSATSILSEMKVGQQYTCTELAGGKDTYQLISACFRRLVRLGVVTRTVIKTGRTLEFPNPKRKDYEGALKRAKQNYDFEPNINALITIDYLEARLSSLPKTITIEEKVTYFTRNF